MKISYNWLKEFVDINLNAEALGEALSLIGFEVEGVEMRGLDLPNLVVGEVLSKKKHPDADKLSVCTVAVGAGEPLTIVCGAPNVAAGQRVAVALVGAVLPGDFKIRKAKIRGVESRGMICSEAELGIGTDSDGIWVLPENLAVGLPLASAIGFESDYVIDLWVPPIRPDAMSHIGIAREAAAIVAAPLKLSSVDVPESGPAAAEQIEVTIECTDGCPRYAARVIRNIGSGQSPEWMERRLAAAGMRPINLVVDITNYVMLETGQPLHAFDYDLLKGRQIIVRESIKGEKFITLDGKEHSLPENTVMICDSERPVAIGGIMGGQNSEVNPSTTHLLLESANFNPHAIQKSIRALGFKSEASNRFEKGVDPNGVAYALDRAAALLAEYAGAEVAPGIVDNYPQTISGNEIRVDVTRINTLLGTSLSLDEMAALLKRISLNVEDGVLKVPTFRADIRQTADIAEEVARIYGYDNIPVPVTVPVPYEAVNNPFEDFVSMLKETLAGAGTQEVITNSMISVRDWQKFTGEEIYPIMNPVTQDMNGMRNSLVPSLLGVLQWNNNRQIRDLNIFEINTVFKHPGDLQHRPEENVRLAIAMTGLREGDAWTSSRQVYDFYDIKGVVEGLINKILLDNIQFIDYDNFAVGIESVQIQSGKKEIGFLGRVNAKLAGAFDIEVPVYVAEIDVKTIYELSRRHRRYRPIAVYPWVERDFALVVDASTPVQKILNEIRSAAGQLLDEAYLFDVYAGSQVEAGKKSLGFRMRFQSGDRTLTEDEVNQSTEKVLKQIGAKFEATLRSN